MPASFSESPILIPTRLISSTPSVQLSSRYLFPKALHKQIPPPEQDVGDQDSDEDDDVSNEEHVDVSDEDSPPNSPNSTNNLKDNSHTPSEHDSRVKEASKHPKNFVTIGDDLNWVPSNIGGSALTHVIKSWYVDGWTSFKKIPLPARLMLFEELKQMILYHARRGSSKWT
ncbi:hypothetical protein ACFE04_021415 [Oxalis oulophora]